MKLIDLTCNKCGAQLKANADLKKCSCNYCGNEMLIDDEVIHHQIDNAFDAGYQAEIGRQQAQFKTTLQQARNAIEIGDYKTAYELYNQKQSRNLLGSYFFTLLLVILHNYKQKYSDN